mgnify:CR=1 FL=1
MAGWLAAIPVIGDLFDKVGGAVDNLITSDEERLKVKAELASLYMPVLQSVMEAQKAYQEMQVKIIEIESKSEHWLVWSRRPIIAYLSIINLIAAAIFKHMDIDNALYFSMLINGLDTGTRGIEKVMGKFKAKEEI